MSNPFGPALSGLLPIIAIFMIGFIVLIVVKFILPSNKKPTESKTSTFPTKDKIPAEVLLEYTTKKYFLSLEEKKFFHLLQLLIIDQGFYVSINVRMEDIFENTRNSRFKSLIGAKHIDFLIFDRESQIKYAIELDGPSHQTKNQQGYDQEKNTVFRAAGLPLLRFQNGDIPTAQNIQKKLEQWQKQRKIISKAIA